jgi:hypothetical protein
MLSKVSLVPPAAGAALSPPTPGLSFTLTALGLSLSTGFGLARAQPPASNAIVTIANKLDLNMCDRFI